MSLFIGFGILMTVLAAGFVVTPLLRNTNGDSAPVMATVTALALPVSVILLYVWVGNFNWNAEKESDSVPRQTANDDVPEMSAAIASLEDRLRREPEDLEGWLLLGRAYVQLREYPAAQQAYLAAIELDSGTEAKLGLAEAEIMIDRNNLMGDAGVLIEEVLVIEPDNPRALFYGGMAAMARNDIDVLTERWRRLLALSPPPNVRQMIEEQLAALGITDLDTVATPTAGSSAAERGLIRVEVSVSDGIAARIDPGAVLFIVAREPERPGPPIAVVRQDARNLPAIIEISDANAMLPGRSISALARVHLIARITNSGEPTAQPGDMSGEAVIETSIAFSDTVVIDVNQVVQ
jgi:cytochrome c-type biogenesis protein CcmH